MHTDVRCLVSPGSASRMVERAPVPSFVARGLLRRGRALGSWVHFRAHGLIKSMRRFFGVLTALFVAASIRVATAQTAGPPAPDERAPAGDDKKAGGTQKDDDPKGEKPSGADAGRPKKPTRPATGYGWSDNPRAGEEDRPRPRPRAKGRRTGPRVMAPGFKMTESGGSRVYVRLSQSPTVTRSERNGAWVFLLEGMRVPLRNNRNILDTTHFDTPVASARLVPTKKGVELAIRMRRPSTPTHHAGKTKDGHFVLFVDFPPEPSGKRPPAKKRESSDEE